MRHKIECSTLLQLFLLVGICCATTHVGLAAELDSNVDRVPAGYHEFEMFGSKSIYLSHYPMFGSIHSYQLLLEVALESNDGKDLTKLYLTHSQQNPDARYSVSPETSSGEPDYWVLPEVMKEGNSFRGNIHWQNKDNHLVYLARNVTVKIKRIIYFRLFQPPDKRPDGLTYLLFGSNSEAYMAHYIGSYPDFDQIVAVVIAPGTLAPSENTSPTFVTISGRDNSKAHRLAPANAKIVGHVDKKGDEFEFTVTNQVHYEPKLEIQR